MAKLCPNCNLKHSNDAEKCVQCGTELEVIKSDVRKKRIIIISIVSIILIALIVGAVIYFTSPEAKVRSILKDFNDGDVEGVINSFPDFFLKSGYLDEEAFGKNIAMLSDYMFSYNIDKVVNPSSSDRDTVLTTLSHFEQYGYDASKLQDIKVIWTNMRGGIPGFWGSSFDKFVMIKYDGAWYWWPYY